MDIMESKSAKDVFQWLFEQNKPIPDVIIKLLT